MAHKDDAGVWLAPGQIVAVQTIIVPDVETAQDAALFRGAIQMFRIGLLNHAKVRRSDYIHISGAQRLHRTQAEMGLHQARAPVPPGDTRWTCDGQSVFTPLSNASGNRRWPSRGARKLYEWVQPRIGEAILHVADATGRRP